MSKELKTWLLLEQVGAQNLSTTSKGIHSDQEQYVPTRVINLLTVHTSRAGMRVTSEIGDSSGAEYSVSV